MDVTIEQVEPRPYLGIRREGVPPAGLGAAMAEMFPAVSQHLRERGIVPASAPMTMTLKHDEAAGTFDILSGFFLAEPVEAQAGFEAGNIRAGEVARTVHAGPYQRLGETYGALSAWIAAQGRGHGGPCWEVYVTDPGEVADPADYRTEVFSPLA